MFNFDVSGTSGVITGIKFGNFKVYVLAIWYKMKVLGEKISN